MTALSSGNSRVKAARKLTRRPARTEERRFLAEGPKALAEALAVDGCTAEVYAAPDADAAYPELRELARRRDVPWSVVEDRALASLSDTVNPQGLVAVCRFLDRPLDTILSAAVSGAAGAAGLVVVCADVRDPGNAGTVIRCADAAGAGAVVLTGSSVDAYNGKTVRATVGSLFHVPLAVHADTAEAVSMISARGSAVLAADGAGELDLDEAIDSGLLRGPTAWLFGNEAWGLSPELASLADHRVRIPIHGRAESLNLSTAAAVCLYASARAQR